MVAYAIVDTSAQSAGMETLARLHGADRYESAGMTHRKTKITVIRNHDCRVHSSCHDIDQ